MTSQTTELLTLTHRLHSVRRQIAAAAARSQRSVAEITLLAVTKTHPLATIEDALALGLKDLGENRIQEAEDKILKLGREAARWHLIGHLQANKARRAVKLFDVIHTVDSGALALRLERHCDEEGRESLAVLIQVDLANEATKSGVVESEVAAVAETIANCQRLQLSGLMTLPPFLADLESIRPYFRKLRELRDTLQAKGLFGERRGELSMGMSHDFEIAIEEGATIVRIGTELFGARGTAL